MTCHIFVDEIDFDESNNVCSCFSPPSLLSRVDIWGKADTGKGDIDFPWRRRFSSRRGEKDGQSLPLKRDGGSRREKGEMIVSQGLLSSLSFSLPISEICLSARMDRCRDVTRGPCGKNFSQFHRTSLN